MTELTPQERESARARHQRFVMAELSPGELAIELERWEQHLAVLNNYPPSPERNAGIRYCDHRIEEIGRQANRLKRAHVAHRPVEKPDWAAAKYVDLVGLVQSLLAQPGVKRGDNWLFHCHWHEDRSPSLTIYPLARGGWFCFGCNRGGSDAASFAAEFFGCSQLEGLRWIETMCAM